MNVIGQSRVLNFSIPEPNSGCWLWLATGNRVYGQIKDGSRVPKLAHRYSYEVFRGAIADGMVVMHSCDTPMCVNPDHLSLGSQADNMRDMTRKGRNEPHRGELQKYAKLTEKFVRHIRSSPATNADLSRMYGVSRAAIIKIKQRKLWAHVQ